MTNYGDDQAWQVRNKLAAKLYIEELLQIECLEFESADDVVGWSVSIRDEILVDPDPRMMWRVVLNLAKKYADLHYEDGLRQDAQRRRAGMDPANRLDPEVEIRRLKGLLAGYASELLTPSVR